MASIVASTEISRSPEDVFAYVTDPTKLPEWQESVVSAQCFDTPVHLGTKAVVTRRVGRREMTMEDVPRAVEFRRRSRCDGQTLRTVAASLLGV